MRVDTIELFRRRSKARPFGLRIRAANGEPWQSGQGYTRRATARRIGERFAARHTFAFVDLTKKEG